jgi:hypothetical protein
MDSWIDGLFICHLKQSITIFQFYQFYEYTLNRKYIIKTT